MSRQTLTLLSKFLARNAMILLPMASLQKMHSGTKVAYVEIIEYLWDSIKLNTRRKPWLPIPRSMWENKILTKVFMPHWRSTSTIFWIAGWNTTSIDLKTLSRRRQCNEKSWRILFSIQTKGPVPSRNGERRQDLHFQQQWKERLKVWQGLVYFAHKAVWIFHQWQLGKSFSVWYWAYGDCKTYKSISSNGY